MLHSKHSLGLGSAFLITTLVACGDDTGASDTSTTLTTPTTPSGPTSDPTSASATGTGDTPTGEGSNSNSNSDTGTSNTSVTSGNDDTSQGEVSTNPDDTTQGTASTSTSSTSSDDETIGIKFDLEPDPSAGTTGDPPPPMKGSCRPSEIHGAAGGFPKFTDPAYATFLDKKIAIVTTNQQEFPNNHVLHIVNIDGAPPPPALNYAAPKYRHSTWLQQNLGKVFGLTLDSAGNIYVAATTVYGGNPWPNKIRKIDGVTGAISDFATLPNGGPAFGNLNYDCISESIYVSSHEDGRIWQLDMMGQAISTYRHSDKTVTNGAAMDPGEPNNTFTPLGPTRVWAVQSHAGRLYYSVWGEDTGRKNTGQNEIWSVAYVDEGGVPDPATAKKEFDAPNNQGQDFSNPVSDLSFAATGWMLISQRTMLNDAQSTAHQSYTHEYQFDINTQTWLPKGMTYVVGELPGSAAGGVDHDFEENGYVWMTGDALDFYTPEVVYGLQGTPHGGGTYMISTIIDMDDELQDQDKTEQGDVELPIPGDAMPVPPPQ